MPLPLITAVRGRARERRAWRDAAGLTDLGELTARWLEGRLRYHPGYRGRPNSETAPLVPILAAVNRAGLLTIASQPGHPPLPGQDGAIWAQRPAAHALASAELAYHLAAAARGAGLLVHLGPVDPDPRTMGPHQITVTTRNDEDYTSFGPLSWRLVRESVGPAADTAALRCAYQITVAGRYYRADDLLWRLLLASARAHAGTGRTTALIRGAGGHERHLQPHPQGRALIREVHEPSRGTLLATRPAPRGRDERAAQSSGALGPVHAAGAIAREELDRIAAEVARGPARGYPAERLYADTPGLLWRGNELSVPPGPWRTGPGHPNRAGAPRHLRDLEDPARIPASERARWRAAGLALTRGERLPVHPDARQLLADRRIGLPTGLGSFWRWGPNPTVDIVVLRADGRVLVIVRRDGSTALPGGFTDPGESAEAAARRELREETGVDIRVGGRAVLIDQRRPTGREATLNAWSHNTAFYLHGIDEDYAAAVQPTAGDDAAGATWIPAQQALAGGLYSTHAHYLRTALALRRTATDT